MVNIALCDDDEIQLNIVYDLVCDYVAAKGIEANISKFADGMQLLDTVKHKGLFDIYFFDMIMPEMTGLDVSKLLREHNDGGKIIFLTSSVDYAIESYGVKAFNYILKPISKVTLDKVLDEAISDGLIADNPTIIVNSTKGEIRLRVNDVMCISKTNRALNYICKSGIMVEGKTLRGSFKDAVFPFINRPQFFLCGVSMVVNLRFIDAIEENFVLLKNGNKVFPPENSIHLLTKAWKDFWNKL